MSLHVFASIVTPYGTAANNRGENEGNTTTLQKLIWFGQPHTTVSAEAIRFALRRIIAGKNGGNTNRQWDEEARSNTWRDPDFKAWDGKKGTVYADDDLLGYMRADAAREEGAAGSCTARRAVLEVTRAISLTPWAGDVAFNAASPGATPSAQKKGAKNPTLYGTELHATRYQFGLALTPERLRDRKHGALAVEALRDLATVAGNHGRFLYDFSPEAIIFRICDDPAPRLLYCFQTEDGGRTFDAPVLLSRVKAGDIEGGELIVGGSFPAATELGKLGATVVAGVKKACEKAVSRLGKPTKAEA